MSHGHTDLEDEMRLGDHVTEIDHAMTSAPVAEHVPVLSASAPDPPFAAMRKAAGPEQVRLIAEAGRAASVVLAVLVPYVATRPLTVHGLLGVAMVSAVWLATIRSACAAGQGMLDTGLAVGIGTVTGLVAVAAIDPWFPGFRLAPILLLGTAVGVFASTAVWEWAVRRTSVGRRRVLLVGSEHLSAAIAAEVTRGDVRGLELVARVAADGDAGRSDENVPVVGGLAELADVVEAQRPDLVVLTDEVTYADAIDHLLDARSRGFRVVGLAGFFEWAFGRVPIEQITPAWFMSLLHPRQRIYTRFSKRTFDVLVAGLGLLVAAPVLAALALLTWVTQGRPILYRQTRVGEGGRQFTIYKLRTLVGDAEHNGPAFSAPADPRATRIGCVLRRTHLDELPQLWNVLKGDMSIVGPRPERPEFIEMLEDAVPFWSRRLLVKPGITGWAQLRCEYASDFDGMAEKLSYDLWYLRHRSLLVDLAVCVMTFVAFLPRPSRQLTPLRR
jgi:exopolysaccharide biosynthesis polyprenyl glycosylphosphotransferase